MQRYDEPRSTARTPIQTVVNDIRRNWSAHERAFRRRLAQSRLRLMMRMLTDPSFGAR